MTESAGFLISFLLHFEAYPIFIIKCSVLIPVLSSKTNGLILYADQYRNGPIPHIVCAKRVLF